MNQHFYQFLEDHTTQGKIAFLHKLADHLRNLAADPAGVQGLAGQLKNIAHALESKVADGADALAAKLGDPRPAASNDAATSAPQAPAK